MAKKNNKKRKQGYVERLKQLEDEREKELERKRTKRDVNKEAKNLVDDIDNIALNLEEDEKMETEKPTSLRKKRKRYMRSKKHGRYS